MVQTTEHQGRVAVIAGGSGGIGGAIACRLASEGASIHILDLNPQQAAEGTSARLQFHQVDVSTEAEVDRAMDSIGKLAGKIDYLVNCAAIYRPRPFLELSLEDWQRTLEINLTGSFLLCRAALRYMRAQKFGRIILFSSMIARTGAVNGAPYSASKGGILGFARSLSIEAAAVNIRVNTISPGITDTPQPRAFLSDADLEKRKARIPLGRIGEVQDLVEACPFLLSDDSSYVVGQDIRVNGGTSLW